MGSGSTQLVAYVASGASIVAILACLISVPTLFNKLDSINSELQRDMNDFQVGYVQRVFLAQQFTSADYGR